MTELYHYGRSKRDGAPGPGSGRYPLGSGDNPFQRNGDFLARVDREREQNIDFRDPDTGRIYKGDTAIAKRMGLSSTQFRVQLAIANEERRAAEVATARRLRAEGNSLNEIAKKMGYSNDSSIRSLLNENTEERMKKGRVTADYLKKIVDEKGMVDVGDGVARELGISEEKLKQALYRLELEGYPTYGGGLPQVTNPGKQTNLRVLCPPGTQHKDIYSGNINSVKDYGMILTDNGNNIRKAFEYPASMDPKRLMVRYNEEGGLAKDGTMEIRRGVKDLDLQGSNYAQVRILVGGTHYLKGMAVYGDNMPPGVDVIFNTNKHVGTPVMGDKSNSVLKPIKKDPNNPFGSLIKDPERGGQYYWKDENGQEHLGLINKKSDEGDWYNWSDKIPSQFLVKQPEKLINQQLNLTMADRKAEYEEIKSLTNPTVKKALLADFADDCDSAAIHLKAAALPGQKYATILPLTTIKDTEVYAPNYANGTKVALVRYPHAGTFEIPILTVNNKNKEGDRIITKNAKDAVGITKNVADRMSGADFDGDTVAVIPISARSNIMSTPKLKGLDGFDTVEEYGPNSPGSAGRKYPIMKDTQKQMGVVSNLITDMTLKGASPDELARAVKHSMVVIDAEKHELDYKRSEKENGIAQLKRQYQGHIDPEDGRYHEGASTLLSRAKGEKSVLKRQGSPHINTPSSKYYDPSKPEGSLVWKVADNLTYPERKKIKDPVTKEYLKDPETGKFLYRETGRIITRTQKSTQMGETGDARTLISDYRSPKELAYANYANFMKSLANEARKEILATGDIKFNASAKKAYQKEVDSLKRQLDLAERNSPRERAAQVLATNRVKAIQADNPGMDKSEIKKARDRELKEARRQVGAERKSISINDREWEAIQNGAIAPTTLSKILKYADSEDIRKRATPRATKELSVSKQNLIKSLKASGFTNKEIADRLGVSSSTVIKYLNE